MSPRIIRDDTCNLGQGKITKIAITITNSDTIKVIKNTSKVNKKNKSSNNS